MAVDLLSIFTPVNLVVFLLIMGRLSGLMLTAPFFSSLPIPALTKGILVLFIGFIMFPMIVSSSTIALQGVLDMPALMVLMTKEVVIGAIIGFSAALIFYGIQMSGNILSMQMGLSIGNILDPVTQTSVPVLGQFYMFLASLCFIFINGHIWLFSSIYNSYKIIPINYDFAFSGAFVERIIYFTSQIFTIAFGIIVPVYAVLIIVAMILGFMSKAMPQMNVFMVALPVKIMIGLAMIMIFLVETGSYISNLTQTFLINIDKMFL